MMKHKKFLILLLLLLTLALRLFKIDQIPASLSYDEVDYGYQARSLLTNLRDYRGEQSLFFVHSFNDIRTPFPAYTTVISTAIFDKEELAVRMPSAVMGTMIVLLIFLIVRIWTNNFYLSLICSFVFASSPWQIQFSRFSHEVTHMLAVYLLGLYFFSKFIKYKKYKNLILGIIFLSLDVYTYRTMSLFVPLTLFILFLIFKKEILVLKFKRIFLCLVLAGIIIIPFIYATTLGAPDQPRINQLSITSDPKTPIFVQRNRELDSGNYQSDEVGRSPSAASYFFHNKLVSWMDSFFNNYYEAISSEFLFIRGDPNLRHSVGQMGELFFIDLIALIAGLFYLLKNLKNKYYLLVFILFTISPIPAALTMDGTSHAARLFIFSLPLLLIVGIGWYQIFIIARKFKYAKILMSGLIGCWLLLFVFYLHRYFMHFPIESARSFGYGFKQAMLKITEEEKNYKKIKMVATIDPPMIYYLFWTKVDPKILQEYGTNFSEGTIKNSPLDKIKVVDIPKDVELSKVVEPDTLYLITQSEIPLDLRNVAPPKGIKLVDLIKYPDNEVAFYLIAKE